MFAINENIFTQKKSSRVADRYVSNSPVTLELTKRRRWCDMTIPAEYVKTLEVGAIQAHENLAIFPLLLGEFKEPGYILLDEALAQSLIEIGEASTQGIVNEILVRNRADRPVLILDGEILVGAKQNRVVNASTLIGLKGEVKIPVSCVEQQRWRYQSENFTESRRFSYARMRAQKNEQVSQCLFSSGIFAADQGAIWDEVDRKQKEMRVESPTQAVNDVYEGYEDKLSGYCEAFQPIDGQAGAVVYVNGEFTCLDSFDSPAVLHKLYKKMVESYALDALELAGQEKKVVDGGAVKELLGRIEDSKVTAYPSVGLGEDLRLSTNGLTGSCLVVGGQVIHLALFAAAKAEGNRPGSPLSRPSRRRRGQQ
jgi:hypothetical protein